MTTVHYQGDFQWDDAKAAKNLAKHGVSFEEAATAFFDEAGITLGDPQGHDDRYVLIGKSMSKRILFVVHAEIIDSAMIRIISARRAEQAEIARYNEGDET